MFAALLLTSAAAEFEVFIGSGGCDVADHLCVGADFPYSLQVSAFTWAAGSAHVKQLGQNATTDGTPSWIHATDRCIFATVTNSSRVVSYERRMNGQLIRKSSIDTFEWLAMYPVHLGLAKAEGPLVVANYGGDFGASVMSLLVGPQCELTFGDSMPFDGSSIDPARQAHSHVHSVYIDTAASGNNYAQVFAADLGADLLYTLRLAVGTGKLELVSTTKVTPGSGPRHMAVHPHLRKVYVVSEIANMVSAHSIDSKGVVSEEEQRLSTVPSGTMPCAGRNTLVCSKAGEIELSPDGSSLFASNRGYDQRDANTLAGFSVGDNGSLSPKQLIPTVVSFPRGMSFTPDGAQLLVAGQGSNNLEAFQVAPKGVPGTLLSLGEIATGLATPTTVAVVSVDSSF